MHGCISQYTYTTTIQYTTLLSIVQDTSLRSELQELEDRSLLSDLLDDVKREITRKKKTKAFDAALETVDSTKITRTAQKLQTS